MEERGVVLDGVGSNSKTLFVDAVSIKAANRGRTAVAVDNRNSVCVFEVLPGEMLQLSVQTRFSCTLCCLGTTFMSVTAGSGSE